MAALQNGLYSRMNKRQRSLGLSLIGDEDMGDLDDVQVRLHLHGRRKSQSHATLYRYQPMARRCDSRGLKQLQVFVELR